jgi:hypothetical protein
LGDRPGEGAANTHADDFGLIKMKGGAGRNPTAMFGIDEHSGQGLAVRFSDPSTSSHVGLADQQEQVELFSGREFGG